MKCLAFRGDGQTSPIFNDRTIAYGWIDKFYPRYQGYWKVIDETQKFDLNKAIAEQEKLVANLQQQAAGKPELATQLRDAIEGLQRLKQMADPVEFEVPYTSSTQYQIR